MRVRPKKFLGQHFLHDQHTAQKIVNALSVEKVSSGVVLEIGPGTGVLTQYLLELFPERLYAVEIDRESIAHLRERFPSMGRRLVEGDFLKADLEYFTGQQQWSIIGNFPYHISSQIFFRILDIRNQVKQVVCMLQKEVGARIAASHGSKTYGILSVLLQTFFHIEYLFTVPPGVFHPPPKVMSSVIRLTRNERVSLPVQETTYFAVVKQAFNNRRKTLRNALKKLNLPAEISSLPLLDKRAEQLPVEDFIYLSTLIEHWRANDNI